MNGFSTMPAGLWAACSFYTPVSPNTSSSLAQPSAPKATPADTPQTTTSTSLPAVKPPTPPAHLPGRFITPVTCTTSLGASSSSMPWSLKVGLWSMLGAGSPSCSHSVSQTASSPPWTSSHSTTLSGSLGER
nr:C-8 sterol isomerase [Cryptococcus tetragattii IND107]